MVFQLCCGSTGCASLRRGGSQAGGPGWGLCGGGCTACLKIPLLPLGYMEWSKPRLLRRISELEKVSHTPLSVTSLIRDLPTLQE